MPSPPPVSIETHDAAVKNARTYGFRVYDAHALAADCETLHTGDFQNGQVIEERLTAGNPFRAAAGAEGI